MYIILRSKFAEAKPQQYIISIIASAGQQSLKMKKEVIKAQKNYCR